MDRLIKKVRFFRIGKVVTKIYSLLNKIEKSLFINNEKKAIKSVDFHTKHLFTIHKGHNKTVNTL